MDLTFRVSARIARPVAEVFEAVADPAILSRYFTTGGALGRLESGATVSWDFADFPGRFPVQVVEVAAPRRIVLRWEASDRDAEGNPYQTSVTFLFEALEDGRTLVSIHEGGWQQTESGLQSAFGNCQGWSQMLCAMKAWLEHGINLREGMYS